jgi:hypothetical protein
VGDPGVESDQMIVGVPRQLGGLELLGGSALCHLPDSVCLRIRKKVCRAKEKKKGQERSKNKLLEGISL